MCTVTFIPLEDSVCFASNRDEQLSRPSALMPCNYEIDGKTILFPKDPQGGGTWIAAHESGNAVVLLNGALKAHKSLPPYRKSRGLVVLDVIMDKSPRHHFLQSDFENIEPFTVILFEKKELYSGWWDGKEKHLEMLDETEPHIWSSATLYNSDIVQKRNDLFSQWTSINKNPNLDDIIYFHRHAGEEDLQNVLCLNSDNEIFTNSISAMQITREETRFKYLDLRNGQSSLNNLPRRKMISVTL